MRTGNRAILGPTRGLRLVAMAPAADPRPEPEDPASGSAGLSHLAGEGDQRRSHMVDVADKPATRRRALARAEVHFPPGVLSRVLEGQGPKGPIGEVARVAGIQAAKRTPEWIPMCHSLALTHADLRIGPAEGRPDCLEILCEVRCTGPTGVEMEALVGASAAALTVIDMTKALSHGIRVGEVRLLEKDGGRSGLYRDPEFAAREGRD
jgi:cyclic pyranopterin phosphate synthase